jgi:hypothetical protein
MHGYSTDSNERRVVPFLLAALAIALAWMSSRFLAATHLSVPWWVDAPSSLGFYGALYALFDKHLWRNRFIRKLGLVRVPSLTGRWGGYLTSSFDEHVKHLDVKVQIFQTWTQISIVLSTATSQSRSCVAAIQVADPDCITLIYQYENQPQASALKTMHMHHGTAMLRISNGSFLTGDYYAGRDRGTFGQISCRKQWSSAKAA